MIVEPHKLQSRLQLGCFQLMTPKDLTLCHKCTKLSLSWQIEGYKWPLCFPLLGQEPSHKGSKKRSTKENIWVWVCSAPVPPSVRRAMVGHRNVQILWSMKLMETQSVGNEGRLADRCSCQGPPSTDQILSSIRTFSGCHSCGKIMDQGSN